MELVVVMREDSGLKVAASTT